MPGMAAGSETIKNHASFIWSVADLPRGDYKQSEYGVVLPLTRFDDAPEPSAVAIDGPRLDPAIKPTEPARTLTKITER